MSLKYRMLAPLIVPKLKKSTGRPDLQRFDFLFNKLTGEQILRATDPNGQKEITGVFDIKDLLFTEKGTWLIGQIDKVAPNWVSIYGIIEIEKKYFSFSMLDERNNKLITLTY